tara:strand:+ start:306 stop:476 length:171 start_codon:yes stop_codon:yes gene_type:complete
VEQVLLKEQVVDVEQLTKVTMVETVVQMQMLEAEVVEQELLVLMHVEIMEVMVVLE